ncbi:hypothetical protein X275_03470 [Marinitoga sp. 1197]|nr:hypothetical protein X274_08160 [Marinitoga sp. 1155]KLO23252.1 hypothetical protein X275_03470 [Marinitoga sp. 1197]
MFIRRLVSLNLVSGISVPICDNLAHINYY